MEAIKHEIIVRGRRVATDAVKINGRIFVVKGNILRTVSIREELYEDVEDPSAIVDELRRAKIQADIFTFWQRLPETSAKFPFYFEWDNFAAVPVADYATWFEKQIDRNARRAIKRAEKNEVSVRVVSPGKNFINGIIFIYNETPVRQGRKFWHFGKTYDEVRREIIEPDNDISVFLGAYFKEQLIGFVKLIFTKEYANFAQILSAISHRDKYPTNALIAKAVDLCAERKIPFLVYERFAYGKKGSDNLSDFKRRNGFQQIDVPRYYVPLSLKGRMALKMGLHHGVTGIIPLPLVESMLGWRRIVYEKIYRKNGKST